MTVGDYAKLLNVNDLGDSLADVDARLKAVISLSDPSLSKPASRVVFAGGKRLRPMLVIASAKACGRKFDDSVARACVAVELLHVASLVHDDIMDRSDERRGRKTINAQEGAEQALLVGDYLIAQAFAQTSVLDSVATKVLSEAFAAMCEGQALELADNFNLSRTVESYKACIEGKTAALMSAACQLGSIGSGIKTKGLGEFGKYLGLSFQLVDDLLDLMPGQTTGKPTGNDIKEGVYTLPVLLSLQKPVRDKLTEQLKLKDKANRSAIYEMLTHSGSIEAVIDQIKANNNKAVKSLTDIKEAEALAKLPDFYFGHVLGSHYPLS